MHTNRGNRFTARYDFQNVPNLDSTPTVTRKAPHQSEVAFQPTSLTGGQKVSASGTWYGVPGHAQAKHRGGLVWVLCLGRIHVLSKYGEIVLTDEQQKHFAANWNRI